MTDIPEAVMLAKLVQVVSAGQQLADVLAKEIEGRYWEPDPANDALRAWRKVVDGGG